MPLQDLDPYKLRLREWAVTLQKSSPGIPVFIQKVCRHLGIKLKRSESVPDFKAYLTVDPSKENPAAILLPPLVTVGSFERLCIAHELAHYFLLSNYELLPSSHSEYWQQEELCDDFARHLLIPDDYIEKKTARTPLDPTSYLALCREIAASAKVPWIHAAIRITETSHKVAYLRCSIPDVGNGGSSDRSRRALGEEAGLNEHEKMFMVRASSFPRHKGIRTKIRQDTPLYQLLLQMMEDANASGLCVQHEITHELRASVKRELLSKNLRAFAEVDRGKFQDVKIVIGFDDLMGHKN